MRVWAGFIWLCTGSFMHNNKFGVSLKKGNFLSLWLPVTYWRLVLFQGFYYLFVWKTKATLPGALCTCGTCTVPLRDEYKLQVTITILWDIIPCIKDSEELAASNFKPTSHKQWSQLIPLNCCSQPATVHSVIAGNTKITAKSSLPRRPQTFHCTPGTSPQSRLLFSTDYRS